MVLGFSGFNTIHAQDTDGDGITNINDLDDDNDGIPDTAENTCSLPADSGAGQTVPHLFWDVNANPFPGKLENNNLSPEATTAASTVVFGSGLPGSQKTNLSWSIQNINSTTAAQAKTNNDYIQFSIPMASSSNKIFELKEWTTYGTNTKVQNVHIEISDNVNFTNPATLYSGQNPTTTSGTFQKFTLNSNYRLQKGTTYYVRVFVYGTATTAIMDSFGLNAQCFTDTDGDNIPDYLDPDSDGDGCPDAMEGDENVANSQLNANGSINFTANGGVNASGIPNLVNSGGAADSGGDQGQGPGSSVNAIIIGCFCYKPAITSGTPLNTSFGITSLGRADTAASSWPMTRKGGWAALEAKTKGFVPNRLTTAQKNTLVPVEGMMVYDTNLDCLSIYDGTAWKCFNIQTCPN